MNLEKVFPIFAAAFAVIYLLAVEQNLALFTYHPKLGEWGWLAQPARTGPPMYWYGWLTTSVLLSWPLVRNRPVQFWLGWVAPLAVIVFFVYFFRDFFLR
jgi:hypothetical protein